MKIFALLAAMLIYISVAMQNAVKVINYPHPGIQLPVVKVEISKKDLATNFEKPADPEAVALL